MASTLAATLTPGFLLVMASKYFGDPNRLFDQAIQMARQHMGNPRTSGVLTSVAKMVAAGVIDSKEAKQSVADLACDLWPTHRDAAVTAMEAVDAVPDPAKIAQLLDPVDLGGQDLPTLRTAWRALAKRQTREAHCATAKLIAGKARKPGPQELRMPDAGLSIWLDAIEELEEKRDVLRALVLDSSANDQMRRRIWAQAMRCPQELGGRFFLDLLPTLFALSDSQHLQQDVINDRDRLTSVCTANDDRHVFAEAILTCLGRTASLEMKTALAQWIHKVGGEGSLQGLEDRKPAQEDLEALKKTFPSNRYVKKLLAQVNAEREGERNQDMPGTRHSGDGKHPSDGER